MEHPSSSKSTPLSSLEHPYVSYQNSSVAVVVVDPPPALCEATPSGARRTGRRRPVSSSSSTVVWTPDPNEDPLAAPAEQGHARTTRAAAAAAEDETQSAHQHYAAATTATTAATTAAAAAALPPNPPSTSSSSTNFRGFSTSIADLFADERNERVDCCAVTCCGLLQHDRDRYLLTGVPPPSLAKRVVMHVFVPVTLFLAAGVCALRIPDVSLNEVASTALLLLLIVYFVSQCAKGRAKRMAIRKDLLYTKYKLLQQQQQQLLVVSTEGGGGGGIAASRNNAYPALAAARIVCLHQERSMDDEDDDNHNNSIRRVSSNTELDYYLGQTRRDIRSAHPCCLLGWYPDDRPTAAAAAATTTTTTTTTPFNNDDDDRKNTLSFCLWQQTLCLCSGRLLGGCGIYTQACGLCALAQEAREIENCVLPASYRRIDYITMEAVLNYYPAIYQHRHHYNNRRSRGGGGVSLLPPPHHPPLVTTATTILEEGAQPPPQNPSTTSALLSPPSSGSRLWLGYPLSRLSNRLLQSLLLFLFVMLVWALAGSYYWTYVIGLPQQRGGGHQFSIYDWVLMVSTFGQAIVLLSIWRHFTNRPKNSELSTDAMIKFFASGFFLSASLALFWEMIAALVIHTVISLILAIAGIDQMDDPQTNWAAPTRTVHASTLWNAIVPNIFIQDELSASSTGSDFATVFGLEHPFLYSVYLLVATFLVAGFIEEVCKYFGFRMVEHPDFFSQEELEEAARILQNNAEDDECDDMDEEGEDANRRRARPTQLEFPKQCQSIQSRGAAITLAMVSVAIGFACCENLIYIFLYGGSSWVLELGILLMRSFFPIHPILAAIQSIGVCQRELEASRATKLGRIIFPAVLFHGSFDFLIVFISFIGQVVGNGVEEGDLRISNVTEFLSIMSCVVVMFAALIYLYNESGKQRERLTAIDQQATIDRSNLI